MNGDAAEEDEDAGDDGEQEAAGPKAVQALGEDEGDDAGEEPDGEGDQVEEDPECDDAEEDNLKSGHSAREEPSIEIPPNQDHCASNFNDSCVSITVTE